MRRTLLAAAIALGAALPAAAFTPNDVECIAPANPGGGWDFTCRTVGRLLHEEGLVPGPVKVTNMPGASGAVAYAHIMADRSADENLIVATSTVGITNIAQGRYPAGVDAMRWLAMLGADVAVLMVAKDSPYNSLAELLDAVKADPTAFVAGGSSSIGGWDHIRLLMMVEAAGVPTDKLSSLRWVEYSGGADAVTQLMGKHVGIVVTDIGEIGGFIQSGDVKPLAVMSEARLKAYPDIPTAREQGIDAIGYNWRGFYMGGKVSEDAYNGWVAIMEKLYNSDAWQKAATEAGLTPIWRGGAEFEAFVRDSEKRAREISKAIGVIK
ncbi:MAG: tricarboxylic transport membrane protein [Paracoccaceae bacterium]|nr:MAG: tricarboxylic transport membrane protein [Paracoccaceae bacterium]